MSISNYLQAADDLADEIRRSFTDQEIDYLHELLHGKSVTAWIKWRMDNERLVFDYVKATPRQRNGKRFQENKPLIAMAAMQHCIEGAIALRASDELNSVVGDSYRTATARAGAIYSTFINADLPYWPFTHIETPFSDDPYLE